MAAQRDLAGGGGGDVKVQKDRGAKVDRYRGVRQKEVGSVAKAAPSQMYGMRIGSSAH